MVLVNHLTYEPAIKEIKKEEQVIELIKDVAVDIHMLGFPVGDYNTKSILRQIEHGGYDAPKQKGDNFFYSVDLSKAQSLIQDYRRKSEGGCQSCKEKGIHKPYPDETLIYCKLYEDYKKLDLVGSSPRINEFSEKECEDRKPIFLRTIEEILEKTI